MLLVIPVSRSDVGLIPTLKKSFDLFPPGNDHDLLVVGSPNVAGYVGDITEDIRGYFKDIDTLILPVDNHMGWPVACNYYFQQTCFYLSGTVRPFLWFELDCTPLKESWLTTIDKDYWNDHDRAHGEMRNPRLYMGKEEQTYEGRNGSLVSLDEAGTHMAPCGVYPGDIWDSIIPLRGIDSNTIPWYVHCQWYINKSLNDSPLFQNNWRTFNYRRDGGKIICYSDANLAWNVHFNEPVSDRAVILHGCKDSSLYEVLAGKTPEHQLNMASDELIEIRKKRRKARMVKHEPPKEMETAHHLWELAQV